MDWLSDANTRWVLIGCTLLGMSSGVLGTFALLRRRSLMGDATAHAALPGVCLAFLITGTRSIEYFMIGALIAGLIGALAIQAITRHSRIKEDAALGIILTVFFAIGIVFLTMIQHSGRANQAGLDKFLFGQAASLVSRDVMVMTVSAAVITLASVTLFKEFKLLCFDPGFAHGQGFSPVFLDGLLNFLIVGAVVIGMQAVGVVLVAAMLITPVAAARLWTDRLGAMVAFAGVLGALSGVLGTLLSTQAHRMPTGPLIVLSATAIFGISFFLAPRKGLLSQVRRLFKLRTKISRENTLRSLYEMAEAVGYWEVGIKVEEVAAQRSQKLRRVAAQMARFEKEGLIVRENGTVRLTPDGLKKSFEVVRNHRLWEMYLMHENQIAADHVDRDADLIEHFLPPDIVDELENLMKVHGKALKLEPSVHPLGVDRRGTD